MGSIYAESHRWRGVSVARRLGATVVVIGFITLAVSSQSLLDRLATFTDELRRLFNTHPTP